MAGLHGGSRRMLLGVDYWRLTDVKQSGLHLAILARPISRTFSARL